MNIHSARSRGTRKTNTWFSPRYTALMLLALSLTAGAAPSNAQIADSILWQTDGTVVALAQSGNIVYLGGYFTGVGPRTGSGAVVDLAAGAVSPAFPRIQGSVRAVAADGSGGWYVGGTFSSVGNTVRNNLAHILADGSVGPWDPSPNARVNALAVSGSTIYVGGAFTAIGGHYQLEKIGAIGVGDETLHAVDEVMIAVAYRSGAHHAGVGAGVGFGLREGGAFLAAYYRQQIALFLFVVERK